jgi:hypothetical protein
MKQKNDDSLTEEWLLVEYRDSNHEIIKNGWIKSLKCNDENVNKLLRNKSIELHQPIIYPKVIEVANTLPISLKANS